jgi:hypothetical protein
VTEFLGFDHLIEGDVNAWVQALPSYQRTHIEHMLETAGPIEVATEWLTSSGPKDTAPYGGLRVGAARFYDNLLLELQKLFCGGQEYEEDRERLGQAAGANKLVMVGTISAALAPHVGVAAAVLGPAIALTLGVVGNAGRTSICQTLEEMIAERAKGDETQASSGGA